VKAIDNVIRPGPPLRCRNVPRGTFTGHAAAAPPGAPNALVENADAIRPSATGAYAEVNGG